MSNVGNGSIGAFIIFMFLFIVFIAIALFAAGSIVGNAIAGTSGVTGKGSLIGIGVTIGLPLVVIGADYGTKYWRMRNEQAARAASYREQQKIQQAAAAAANTPEAIAARQAEYNVQQAKVVAEKAAYLAAYNAAHQPAPVSGTPAPEKFEIW